MSLKRHPALQPFSREHLTGLFHAHQLMWLSNGRARQDLMTTVANFKQAWDEEIFLHFAEEERLFEGMPVSSESLERLMSEHGQIREAALALFQAKPDDTLLCLNFGQLLNDHIRWEERYFYPEIEQALSAEALVALAEETKAIDARHNICRNQ
jgi:hemerythrin-like domain-containing protein